MTHAIRKVSEGCKKMGSEDHEDFCQIQRKTVDAMENAEKENAEKEYGIHYQLTEMEPFERVPEDD